MERVIHMQRSSILPPLEVERIDPNALKTSAAAPSALRSTRSTRAPRANAAFPAKGISSWNA